MKKLIVVLLVAMMPGCGLELVTTTAIQSELQAEQLKAVNGQVSRASDTTARINIQRAIDTYYAETGRYPATLDELVPQYLPSLPVTPAGTPYAYDPATGKLQGDAPATAPAAAGAGPMGEAATGIAIQNQLNSMGQGGANAAQSRSREALGDVTEQHNQQQEQALKELGM